MRGATRSSTTPARSARCFNPRPRAGGDLSHLAIRVFSDSFQSAPPCGGRHKRLDLPRVQRRFQSAPPCGGRPRHSRRRACLRRFQSAPPCGGRRGALFPVITKGWFQSAPPCGGRRPLRLVRRARVGVSIRAPVRGATAAGARWHCRAGRFNPRPRAGGDVPLGRGDGAAAMFQSAPPCGGRLPHLAQAEALAPVSIRAPVRGATGPRKSVQGSRMFQSAPPCGGRLTGAANLPDPDWFQSAPPCGGRRVRRAQAQAGAAVSIRAPVRGATIVELVDMFPTEGFNPRPRAGGDDASRNIFGDHGVSIRAPVRGATSCQLLQRPLARVSIRAPVRGATAL